MSRAVNPEGLTLEELFKKTKAKQVLPLKNLRTKKFTGLKIGPFTINMKSVDELPERDTLAACVVEQDEEGKLFLKIANRAEAKDEAFAF